eukprot:UN23335
MQNANTPLDNESFLHLLTTYSKSSSIYSTETFELYNTLINNPEYQDVILTDHL